MNFAIVLSFHECESECLTCLLVEIERLDHALAQAGIEAVIDRA